MCACFGLYDGGCTSRQVYHSFIKCVKRKIASLMIGQKRGIFYMGGMFAKANCLRHSALYARLRLQVLERYRYSYESYKFYDIK